MDKSNQQSPDYLSRSALAEKLDIPLKDLTQLMMDSSWIIQEGKSWRLTAKGEFEGGIYRESKKYGQYIVWPSSIVEHPMIRDIHDEEVSVSVLSKQLNLPARLLNKLLSEMAWIKPFAKGWQVSSLGQLFGAKQAQNTESGIHYVMWPRDLIDHKAIKGAAMCLSDNANTVTLNGIQTDSHVHGVIGSWLYIVGLSYSFQRELFLNDNTAIKPDFYLPDTMVCIDYWPKSLTASELGLQLSKRECYKKYNIKSIEVEFTNIHDLDHDLSRQLMQMGITVY